MTGKGTGRTVQSVAWVSGVELTTGRRVEVRLEPGRTRGVVFNGTIPADIENAGTSGHATFVGRGRDRVVMVEHLLAACYGLGIGSLAVTVTGSAMPFLDGSSSGFVTALKRAGIPKVTGPARPATLRQPLVVRGNGGLIVAWPAPKLAVQCLAVSPADGRAEIVSLDVTPSTFEHGIAGARTVGPGPVGWSLDRIRQRLSLRFGLRRKAGMVMPARERLRPEFCRHKILDLLGDLALLGRPLRAGLLAVKPGHRLNLAFVRELRRTLEA